MKQNKSKKMKQIVDVAFRIDIQEILDKKVSEFGSGSHIIIPSKHRGKKAKVIIYK